ncbi:hypothetical protein [Actinomadura madurae]|nr:hypothetical protein [Actinomadura madurae]
MTVIESGRDPAEMSQSSPLYRDYHSDRNGARDAAPRAVPTGKPTPGYGTVFVQRYSDGTWVASWQEHYPAPRRDGAVAGVEDYEGTEKEVLAWARSRPAARFLIFSPHDDDYIPLTT